MIKLDKRGRRANNEELANALHGMSLGEVVRVHGSEKRIEEVMTLANSLSRTHKSHNKTRFSVRARKDGSIAITCIKNKKPETWVII